MIALSSECLLFQLASGECVPCLAEMISVEVTGADAGLLDPDVLRHAAASVFHYFKEDLARESVTVGEFAGALEKVLRCLGITLCGGPTSAPPPPDILEADLDRMTREAGDSLELFFFPRLRDALRAQLRRSPRLLRFHGLRGCVKQLAGARRWSRRCEAIQDQIIGYLRGCLVAEPEQKECALVVE
ncbi:MAG: hypothetical protein KGJ60_07050 [Verrucomicrobiota bacterium]|nr:hypothetical protein [Verrucomicrobiota bacterium]